MKPDGLQSTAPILMPSEDGLFRSHVVSLVRAYITGGASKAEALARAAAVEHPTLDGRMVKVCERTIRRWVDAFGAEQYAGLEPKPRKSRARVDEKYKNLLAFAAREKKNDPCASLPELLRRARALGIIKEDFHVNRSSFWRLCQRSSIPVRRRALPRDQDTRRFEYPHRMMMVLSDGKHFRAGSTRVRRVALIFLDDHSRYALHGLVGTSESTVLFLQGVFELLQKVGLMDICYLDHGAGFISNSTWVVFNNLEIPLIHGKVRYPEGHGKIEKFNQTLLMQSLRGWNGRPDIDPSCAALTIRLNHFLREVYNHTPHEALNLRTPAQVFHGDDRSLRFPQDERSLRAKFRVELSRRVSADHIVPVDSVQYEVPRGYAKQRVKLYYKILENQICFLHDDQLITLHPVDKNLNARSRRAKAQTSTPEQPAAVLPRSAADILYDRDLGPVVGADGGFLEPTGSAQQKE